MLSPNTMRQPAGTSANAGLKRVAAERSEQRQLDQITGVLAEQRLEPHRIRAGPVDHEVETVHRLQRRAAPIRAERQPDPLLPGHCVGDPAVQVADPVVGQ